MSSKRKTKQGKVNNLYMPDHIRVIVLKSQLDRKIACGCNISIERTIYRIVEEWNEMKGNPDQVEPVVTIDA